LPPISTGPSLSARTASSAATNSGTTVSIFGGGRRTPSIRRCAM
jgi:hypothetical protein